MVGLSSSGTGKRKDRMKGRMGFINVPEGQVLASGFMPTHILYNSAIPRQIWLPEMDLRFSGAVLVLVPPQAYSHGLSTGFKLDQRLG